jgi:hypothetical protein
MATSTETTLVLGTEAIVNTPNLRMVSAWGSRQRFQPRLFGYSVLTPGMKPVSRPGECCGPPHATPTSPRHRVILKEGACQPKIHHPDATHTPATITPRVRSVQPSVLRLRPILCGGRGFFTLEESTRKSLLGGKVRRRGRSPAATGEGFFLGVFARGRGGSEGWCSIPSRALCLLTLDAVRSPFAPSPRWMLCLLVRRRICSPDGGFAREILHSLTRCSACSWDAPSSEQKLFSPCVALSKTRLGRLSVGWGAVLARSEQLSALPPLPLPAPPSRSPPSPPTSLPSISSL